MSVYASNAYGANPNRTGVAEYFSSIFEQVSGKFYEVKNQGIMWDSVIPGESIDRGVNPGANSISYMVEDWRGKGAFRSKLGQNVPAVNMVYGKNTIPIEAGGVSAIMDTDEIRQVQMGMRRDLKTQFPDVMRNAIDLHNESVFFYGDSDVGFLPFLDYPGVPVSNAASTGSSSGTQWSTKTPDQILEDLSNAMSTVWVNSKQRHKPNWIALPSSSYAKLVQTRMGSYNDTTIMEFFKKSNLYTVETGNEIEIIALPYLEDAGVGSVKRMIVGERKAENFIMPYSIDPTLLDPQYDGFAIKLFAEYKFGSVHLPYPNAFIYVDGI